MPLFRVPRPFLVVLAASFAVALTAGCSTTGGAAPPSPRAAVEIATRTVVEFGPDAVVVAEVIRIGDDAAATVQFPDGLGGSEVLLGTDHYVRLPGMELVLGSDRWIHTDLSDPAQRRFHRENPAGLIAIAAVAHLRLGDEFAGLEILEVRELGDGAVLLDLGEQRTIEVATETVVDPEPIIPPPPDQVVQFLDLPSEVELPSMLDGG